MATDWSITHSPMPRYLSTHLATSLFSPEIFSVLKLGLGGPAEGAGVSVSRFHRSADGGVECGAPASLELT